MFFEFFPNTKDIIVDNVGLPLRGNNSFRNLYNIKDLKDLDDTISSCNLNNSYYSNSKA